MTAIESRFSHGRAWALSRGTLIAACLLAFTNLAGADGNGVSQWKPGRQSIAAAQNLTSQISTPESNQVWRGESQANLVTQWARWLWSIPFGVTPLQDNSGANCGINQSGEFWYVVGALTPSFTKSCTVPYGKAIVAPIIASVNDYPCPYPFEPAPGQSLEAFLRADPAAFMGGVTFTEALLDGRQLKVKRVATKLFGFIGAADLSTGFDPCITGAPQLAVVDGFFTFVEPPSRGNHVLQVRSIAPWGEGLGILNLKIE